MYSRANLRTFPIDVFSNRFASKVYDGRSFIEIINNEFNEKIKFNVGIGVCMRVCVVYELEFATHPMCILLT